MNTDRGATVDTADQERKYAELRRLEGHFAAARDDAVALQAAERMLQLDPHRAARYLAAQVGSPEHRAEVAVRALREGGGGVGPEVVAALEAAPDDRNLAQALPTELDRPLRRRLLAVLPRVTEAPAVRYLVQRIAEADLAGLDALRAFGATLEQPLLTTAFQVGLAAAGDK